MVAHEDCRPRLEMLSPLDADLDAHDPARDGVECARHDVVDVVAPPREAHGDGRDRTPRRDEAEGGNIEAETDIVPRDG